MQNCISLSAVAKRFLFGLAWILSFSFAAVAGGKDTYQVYLNNKLLLTERDFEKVSSTIKALQLSEANYNDQIVIHYTHCGMPGKERKLVLKNDQGKIFGEWRFADAVSRQEMKIRVKEIWDKGYKSKSGLLSLHYYSKQLSHNGRMLAPVTLGNNKITTSATQSGNSVLAGLAGIVLLVSVGGVLLRREAAI